MRAVYRGRIIVLSQLFAVALFAANFQSTDGLKLRSAGTARLSPDGTKIAYTITRSDLPGRSLGQLFILDIATNQSVGFSAGDDGSGSPVWSPDGKWIAYSGKLDGKSGLIVARPDGTGKKYITQLEWTNSPLPTTGSTVAWSPDASHIAWVTAQPGACQQQ